MSIYLEEKILQEIKEIKEILLKNNMQNIPTVTDTLNGCEVNPKFLRTTPNEKFEFNTIIG